MGIVIAGFAAIVAFSFWLDWKEKPKREDGEL
jgi:hypothetical protein